VQQHPQAMQSLQEAHQAAFQTPKNNSTAAAVTSSPETRTQLIAPAPAGY
jgi:hypothetical protein